MDPAQEKPSTAPATETNRSLLLTINGGSSSLKFAVFEGLESRKRILSDKIDRIGDADAQSTVKRLVDRLEQEFGMGRIEAIGHRIVHGGDRFHLPERVTPELIAELKRITAYAPNHLPGEIALIEAFRQIDPDRTQAVCFDTAFHHEMPRVAQIVPIPRRYENLGVRRYGFHGLSYSYLMEELERVAGAAAARGRVILAHLGAGASLAAVQNGRPVDTTMGFTPTAGIVMATRTGDIDPGLVGFLAHAEGMTPDQFYRMTNHDSGLLGVSETSSDFRDLVARMQEDVRAAEAVDLFCYRVRQAIGAFAAVLGGVETLVFSGGIGENSAEARRRICSGLELFGIVLCEDENAANAPLVSYNQYSTKVRVIPTDEESMIAKYTAELIRK